MMSRTALKALLRRNAGTRVISLGAIGCVQVVDGRLGHDRELLEELYAKGTAPWVRW